MAHAVEDEFKLAFRNGLAGLEQPLIGVLRQLATHNYPSEVVAIDFEVFSDSWSDGFPVRAFFMDATNCEHFVYVDGSAEYPSPVDPGLLTEAIISDDVEWSLLERAPEMDAGALGEAELFPWFIACWQKAAGGGFLKRATLALHDDAREFDLIAHT
ncbi:hypothetical protein C7C56_017975 [Massilia glaciei]|uniref:Uncharacterized protein n=2 Tax=Massilia glaciei TaxID=1524097 RepID=A0A2U2HHK1_9BURK|nr:hypothetical protein C7C56_017975 [Massilia glaciei]